MKNKIHVCPNYFLNATHNIEITVIGCGGNGSLMVSRLARIDYALKNSNRAGLNVTVYDGDIVEKYNIGRQMFGIGDIGVNKAIAICSKINRNFLTTFKGVARNFDLEKDNAADIVITCVDNGQFRYDFDAYFKNRKCNSLEYWMDLGNAKNIGQCILGSNHIDQGNNSLGVAELPTILDRFPNFLESDTPEIQGENCSSFVEKLEEQNLFVNDVLTSGASHLLWEMLSIGYIKSAGFFMNLNDLKINPILI